MARVKFIEYDEKGNITATAILEQGEKSRLGFVNYIIREKDTITNGMKVGEDGVLIPDENPQNEPLPQEIVIPPEISKESLKKIEITYIFHGIELFLILSLLVFLHIKGVL